MKSITKVTETTSGKVETPVIIQFALVSTRQISNQSKTSIQTKTSIQPYLNSDHDLITLSLDLTQQPRGQGLWHFNNSFLNEPVFAEDIRSFWDQWLSQKQKFDSPLIWWDKAKQHFKQIAIRRTTTLQKISQECTQLERNLEKLQQKAINSSPMDIENYLTMKEKLKQFKLPELEAIKIRTKAHFTEEGEKSTCYFYSLEKSQQANHTIKTLTKDNMDTTSDTYDIISETYHFYKSLCSAEATDSQAQCKMFDTYPFLTLTEENRNSCNAPLTEHKLHQAPSSMENNKLPGINGLATNFYKFFWNLFGWELTAVYNYAFPHGTP